MGSTENTTAAGTPQAVRGLASRDCCMTDRTWPPRVLGCRGTGTSFAVHAGRRSNNPAAVALRITHKISLTRTMARRLWRRAIVLLGTV